MVGIVVIPALIQATAMLADEGWFHRRRGLPRWERIGHPLDTLTTALCYGWLVATRPEAPHALSVYIGLAIFSCLFITKDELVHAAQCEPREIWLHSILFVTHPVVLMAFGLLWWSGGEPVRWILQLQLLLTLAFAIYQVLYWSVFCNRTSTTASNRAPRAPGP
jgi:hypothetical protein